MSTQNKVISNGPGKSDLMFSLFNGKVVTFQIQKEPNKVEVKTHKMRVTTMMMEDGSHDSWLIQAYFVDNRDSAKSGNIYFYYHSGKRTGIVTPDKRLEIIQKGMYVDENLKVHIPKKGPVLP